ncbi:phosphate ABC transporter permease PstA [Natronospora cellulosivora (SeqCode)]
MISKETSKMSLNIKQIKIRHIKEKIAFSILGLALFVSIAILLTIIYFVLRRGIGVINWTFLSDVPRRGMTEGGIFPAILGTFYLVITGISIAAPLGVLSAVYLNEYAKNKKVVRFIRVGINNLAGVPSVVFGLFGLAVFVKVLGFGVSILSGGITLAIVILPTIIRASEEALIAVPDEYRRASLALGITKWQTSKKVVLPAAMPGILTGVILGVGRVAGETAPIMFTAATFYTMRLPSSIFSEVMALPFHIYALVTTGTVPDQHIPFAFGTAFVLLSLVLIINLVAIVLRIRYNKLMKR